MTATIDDISERVEDTTALADAAVTLLYDCRTRGPEMRRLVAVMHALEGAAAQLKGDFAAYETACMEADQTRSADPLEALHAEWSEARKAYSTTPADDEPANEAIYQRMNKAERNMEKHPATTARGFAIKVLVNAYHDGVPGDYCGLTPDARAALGMAPEADQEAVQ